MKPKHLLPADQCKNIQCLIHSGGINKYICKYIGKIDENNYVIIRAHPHDPGVLISQAVFLHNTKVSGSAINAKKEFEKKRGNKRPKGRAISLMEMIQVMLNYPQVHTDMVFEMFRLFLLNKGLVWSVKARLVLVM